MKKGRILSRLFGLAFVLALLPGYSFAGTMLLDSFDDLTTNPINLPATNLLVARLNTSVDAGGDKGTQTTVAIGGSVVAADIAQVCVYYGGVAQSCQSNPANLSGIALSLANTKGGSPFTWDVTLNASAAGKTFQFTVLSFNNATAPGTPGVSLPQSTATVNIAAASTPPAIDTPTFTAVTSGGATLGGNITSLGTAPAANNHGTAWNHTGSPVTQNASSLGTPSLGAFTDARTGMNSADQVFFRAFVTQSSTDYYTAESSFFTYPANDPTGFSIDQITENSMRINWTDSLETGDAGGAIVIVSEVDSTITVPLDGNEYTGDASYPFSVSSGTNDFVVYRGQTGGSVTLTSLPSSTQFWVAIYSYSGTGTGATGVRYKATTATTGTETTNAPLTAPTVTVQAATAIGTNGATLHGTVTVNGSAADNDTYFKYGTSSGVYTVTTASAGTVTTGAFSLAVTGLNPNTTYYYIACATANEPGGLEGCSAGEQSFTTDHLAPTVTVQAASSIGSRTATLNGTITVNGSAADNDTYFKYGTSPGVYTVTTGTAGTVATGPFSLAVTGLEPSTTYYYIACATANEVGGLEGCSSPSEATFTTDPLTAPTVTVQAASAIGANGATLNGTVTVNGSAVDNNTYFKYGTSSGVYTVTTATAGTVATGPFSLAITGLDPSTTYFYIACATANETAGLEGCSSGEQSFTTTADLTAPTVTVQAATAIGTNGATLHGTVTVNGSAADNDTYFKYGTSSGVYTVTTGSAGTVTTGAFSLAVTGLNPNTTYYYIACATANEPGGLEGCSSGEQSFTTNKLAPTVTVQAATSIGSRTATLNGTVTVNGSAANNNTYFKYGTSTGVYTVTTATAGTVATGPFSLAVTGLEPSTTYYYIACATANEAGGLEGCSSPSEATFTTDPLTAPTVTVQAATAIGSRTATLNGTVTVNGSATNNNTYFEYGTSSGAPYDTTTATVSTIATGAFALPVTGLQPNTIYYYRACATANEAGGLTGCSTETSFTTDPLTAPTVTVQAATSIGTNGATLNGNVTVNGSAINNDTYFKYGISSGGPYDTTTTSAGTVATGPFSKAVTGLTSDVTYYYIACATANETGGLEGCSASEQSFTTVASVSQPTNLWFHNIGSTAMTLYWTEGIGDGSIVLMKQGSAVDATPVDGTEHVADSVFGAGAQIGTGNYVVYRGNGGAVHVTGLTQGLTYHVAVYTYTGAGALIEYLLPNPAIGNQTTADYTPHNVAVLNVDDTVTCQTACHGGHGSALVPRGTDQETACFSCHNPDSGVPGASALTDYALHTNSKNSPVNSPGVVDCGSCHELHNPGTDDTTYSVNPDTLVGDYNLHYLRANADKYVPGALSSDLVAHTDTNSDDWAFEGGLAYQGACQICHTLTSNYQNTPGSNDSHQGSGTNNVDCRGCHTHGGSFAGAGGDCTACHSQIQDKDGAGGNPGRRIVTTEFSGGSIVSSHLPGTLDAADCEVCHDQSNHQQGQVTLFDVDGGASIQIASYVDPRTSSTEAAKLTAFCVACHDSNGANGDTSPFTTGNTALDISTDWTNASHNTNGSVSCFGDGAFGCHGSGHGGQKLTLLAPAETGPGTNNSDEREQFCFNCHDGSPGIDILTFFSGPRLTATSASGASVSNRHDVLPTEQTFGGVVTCNNCHLPHKNNDANPVADPDDGALLSAYSIANSYTEDGHNFTYNSGGNLDPVNPQGATGGPYTQPDYIKFCLTCHDGTTPPGVTMTPNMTNLASAWGVDDQHGRAEGSTGSRTGKGGLKLPWVTTADNTANNDPTAPYAALNCTTCHGAHGSGNIFNLKSSITVAGRVMTVGGVNNMNEAAYNGSATYTLPLIGGVQTDHYWGAWCTFCHKMDAHPGKVQADACTGGHMHAGGAF